MRGIGQKSITFLGIKDTVLTPDDKGKYTLAFAADGGMSVRFNCNRGRGTWKSAAANQIEFGPLALTRAMCPPGSLHDHFVRQWPFVRGYVVKGEHFLLSLMADGGIYEFEPTQ